MEKNEEKQTFSINVILVCMAIIALCLVIYFDEKPKPKGKGVSLPEEIGVARKGDKMVVDCVDIDSVYVEFDNPKNRQK